MSIRRKPEPVLAAPVSDVVGFASSVVPMHTPVRALDITPTEVQVSPDGDSDTITCNKDAQKYMMRAVGSDPVEMDMLMKPLKGEGTPELTGNGLYFRMAPKTWLFAMLANHPDFKDNPLAEDIGASLSVTGPNRIVSLMNRLHLVSPTGATNTEEMTEIKNLITTVSEDGTSLYSDYNTLLAACKLVRSYDPIPYDKRAKKTGNHKFDASPDWTLPEKITKGFNTLVAPLYKKLVADYKVYERKLETISNKIDTFVAANPTYKNHGDNEKILKDLTHRLTLKDETMEQVQARKKMNDKRREAAARKREVAEAVRKEVAKSKNNNNQRNNNGSNRNKRRQRRRGFKMKPRRRKGHKYMKEVCECEGDEDGFCICESVPIESEFCQCGQHETEGAASRYY
jgi:hypothetical protein